VSEWKRVVFTLSTEVISSHSRRSPIDFWLISRAASRLHKFNVAFYSFVWLLLPRGTSLLLENAMETALLQAKGRRSTCTDNLPGI